MTDTKITGLTALTGANLASGDQLVVVDVSDTTMDASGTNKKITADELAAGIGWKTTSKTANYTAVDRDYVLADASGGAFTVTLPSPTANRRVAIKKTDTSTGVVTVATTSGNIDGASTRKLTVPYQGNHYVADGTNWFRLEMPDPWPVSPTWLQTGTVYQSLWPISSANLSAGGGGLGVGFAQGFPFMLAVDRTIQDLTIEVTTAGTASGTCRFALYDDDGTFYPGSLNTDYGTVATDSTGYKTLTINHALKAGTVYWLALNLQTGAGSPAFRSATMTAALMGRTSTETTPRSVWESNTGWGGAAPSTFGLNSGVRSGGGAAALVRVMARCA